MASGLSAGQRQMLLEFNDINYKYPGSTKDVFKDLTCAITAPGFHSLFGPSGVGKTTLAKMMTGDIVGFSGEISVRQIHHILYAYNLERLPGWTSVQEHLAATTPDLNKGRIDELVAAFGLEACMNSRFAQLSLGQQNRTNLARYLLQDFDFLIMDESLANVDEVTKEKIILKMKTMFPQRCFLYISHNVVEVAKFCKQIIILRSLQKTPQTVSIRGQDYSIGMPPTSKDLENTMLEIVNAL